MQGLNEFISIVAIIVFAAQLFLFSISFIQFLKEEESPAKQESMGFQHDGMDHTIHPPHGNWQGEIPEVHRGLMIMERMAGTLFLKQSQLVLDESKH